MRDGDEDGRVWDRSSGLGAWVDEGLAGWEVD